MIGSATVYPSTVRDAMTHWPTGVAVVTTADQDGWWWGCTADSFTAVSMRPPLISVCLDREHRCRRTAYAKKACAEPVLASPSHPRNSIVTSLSWESHLEGASNEG